LWGCTGYAGDKGPAVFSKFDKPEYGSMFSAGVSQNETPAEVQQHFIHITAEIIDGRIII
jgi:hypothetical protein